MRTLTFEAGAWTYRNDLTDAIGEKPRATLFLPFVTNMSDMGYVRVGTMSVTVRLDDDDTLRNSAAETIRAEIKEVQAKAQNAITELTRKLNEVLALECA